MDERTDLTALELDEGRRELLVAAIMLRATPDLARRAALDVSPMLVLSGWIRPALAAAVLVTIVSVPFLVREVREPGPGADLSAVLAVPAPVDDWLTGERGPTIGDLLIAMESEDH